MSLNLFSALVNLDLFAVGIAVAATTVLGFTVFFRNKKSATNRAFLVFTVLTALWGIGNYAAYNVSQPHNSFWLFRITIFLGTWHSFSLFRLLYIFPHESVTMPRWYRFFIVPSVATISALTLTSLIFERIGAVDEATGRLLQIVNGPLMPLFGIVVLGLVVGSIAVFFKTTSRASGIERKQFRFILSGIVATFMLLMIFNFILPAFFDNPRFIPLGPVFIFPFVAATSYAILRHGFFNIKVVATEVLTFVLAVVALFEVVLARDFSILMFRSSIFLLILALGILLIRSVFKEVEAREEIERLAKDLEFANKELKRLDQTKSDFISIASHQLRTPLSIIKGYVSMIREGSYGNIPASVRKTLNKIYHSNERLIKLVADLLDLSRMESGKLQYEFAEFNIVDVIDSTVDEFRIPAGDKNIELKWSKPEGQFVVWGDAWKLRQVIFNLIDNGLKYAEKGFIAISLQKAHNVVTLSVKDTGVGMTPEVARGLFQKFARGKDSFKTNVQGLGLGLFIAKRIVDDHQGKLWADSEGEGKGSVFFIELPTAESVLRKKEFQSFVGNL